MAGILIVDDETSVLKSLRSALELEGYTIATAASGAEAVMCLNNDTIEIVILDLNLKSESGIGLLSRIKTDFPLVKVLAMSGDNRLLASVDQADATVAKPLVTETLIRELERLSVGQRSE